MIVACGKAWDRRIMEYIGHDYARCLYLYLDLLEYGFSSPFTEVFAQTVGGKMTAVLLRYHSCIHIFARNAEAADIPELAQFIVEGEDTIVYCVREIAEALTGGML